MVAEDATDRARQTAPPRRAATWPDGRRLAGFLPAGRIVRLDVPLGTVVGVALVLDEVRERPGGFCVRAHGVRSELTEGAVRRYRREFEEWLTRRDDPMPAEPAEAVFRRVVVAVADGLGTAYRLEARVMGGTGTEWEAEWRFSPAPQGDDIEVRVRSAGVDGERVVPVGGVGGWGDATPGG